MSSLRQVCLTCYDSEIYLLRQSYVRDKYPQNRTHTVVVNIWPDSYDQSTVTGPESRIEESNDCSTLFGDQMCEAILVSSVSKRQRGFVNPSIAQECYWSPE